MQESPPFFFALAKVFELLHHHTSTPSQQDATQALKHLSRATGLAMTPVPPPSFQEKRAYLDGHLSPSFIITNYSNTLLCIPLRGNFPLLRNPV